MTTLPLIITAILSALAANLGTYDLSGSDQVKEGTYDNPPRTGVPFACLPPAEEGGSEGQARNAYYIEAWTQRIRLWAPVVDSQPETRAATSRAIAMEAIEALDTVRASGGSAPWKCLSWVVSRTAFVPSAPMATPGWAYAEIVVTFRFRRLSGTGA